MGAGLETDRWPGFVPCLERRDEKSTRRRELSQIIDADRPFQCGNLNDRFLKAILAEVLMLLLLHVLADRVELMRRHDLAQRRKQVRVLARGMRTVHDDERLHCRY